MLVCLTVFVENTGLRDNEVIVDFFIGFIVDVNVREFV